MPGLFDLEGLLSGLNGFGDLGALDPRLLQQSGNMNPLGEVNPSPIEPGGIPLPRPNPLQPPPDVVENAFRLPGPTRGLTASPDPTVPTSPTAAMPPPAATPSLDQLRIDSDVGAALAGGPPPGAPTDIGAQRKATQPAQTDQAATLATALKGLASPPQPRVQTVQSPAAPRPVGQIKPGDLQALLLALNAGAPALGRLPVTLGGRG